MTIRIETLGSLRVRRDGEEMFDLPSQRIRCALLVYLAVEEIVTRDDVMTVLWPDKITEKARHSLSQALYELKQDLGDGWLDVRGERLATTAAVDLDATRFREAAESDRPEEALSHYGGPFLEGIHLVESFSFESWTDRVRARYERLHGRVRSAAVAAHRAGGGLDEALRMAREWVEHDPLDDEAQHVLIELLGATGRRTEALRQYRLYESVLAAELEVEPLEQTRALVESLRAGSGTGADPVPRPPSAPMAQRQTGGWSEKQLAREVAPGLEILRLLGQGVMSSVYLAREPALKRLVAVKVLRSELAEDGTSRLRFEREAQTAARVSHPNVATIYAVGALSSGAPYIAMEYVHGRTLAGHAAALGTIGTEEARRVIGEVASALAAAHAKGIVHRDVRPANVMIEDPSGRAVLTDFGVAAILATGDEPGPRLTKTGEIIGNPIYLSPEQLAGGQVAEEADVYSLGMLAYEILTTSARRGGPLVTAQLRSQGTRVSEVRPDVDPALEAVVERCLAPEPEHRPSAGELVRMLAGDHGKTLAVHPEPKSGLVRFLDTLRERRVPHTLGLYVGGTLVLYEVASQLAEDGVLSTSAFLVTLLFFPVGFAGATVIAWFHGKKGPQAVPRAEVLILSALLLVWIVLSFLIAGGG